MCLNMIKTIKSKQYSKLLKAILTGTVIGFIYGLAAAAIHIIRNGYFHYELYNLILLTIQENTTKYSLIFMLLFLVAFILVSIFDKLYGLVGRHFPVANKSINKKVPN